MHVDKLKLSSGTKKVTVIVNTACTQVIMNFSSNMEKFLLLNLQFHFVLLPKIFQHHVCTCESSSNGLAPPHGRPILDVDPINKHMYVSNAIISHNHI